jgi:hypothetical protein
MSRPDDRCEVRLTMWKRRLDGGQDNGIG